MKKHTSVYLDYFDLDRSSFIPCEYHWALGRECVAVDINHIVARGMGGNPKGDKDEIKNLMAMCRESHLQFGDKKQYRELLIEIHQSYMQIMSKNKP